MCIDLNYFPRLRKRFRSSNLLERSIVEGSAAADESDRPLPWTDQLLKYVLIVHFAR